MPGIVLNAGKGPTIFSAFAMNWRRWLFLAGFLIVAFAVAGWYFRANDVRFSFVRYQEIGGERYAVLAVENRSSEGLFCIGKPGTPDCHFRVQHPDGTIMGPAGVRLVMRPLGFQVMFASSPALASSSLHAPTSIRTNAR